MTTTRTRDRQPRSHVSRGTSSRPKWMRLSLCVHSCRSTTVWTTWPSRLQEGEEAAPYEPRGLWLLPVLARQRKETSIPALRTLLERRATHITGTVTAHQRFVRGLFLHRGLVRCTWVMEMKTGENGNETGEQQVSSFPLSQALAPLVPGLSSRASSPVCRTIRAAVSF